MAKARAVTGVEQSAAARRAAEAELRALVAKFAPKRRSLVSATRRWLRSRLPTAHEVVYEYRHCFVIAVSPTERGYEGVFSVYGDKNGVRLYFNVSKGLPDPEKLLLGSGTKARYVELMGASTLARKAVVVLRDEAITRNRVPFARTGRGSIVLSPAASKKKRKGA